MRAHRLRNDRITVSIAVIKASTFVKMSSYPKKSRNVAVQLDRLRESFTVISGVPERTKATRKVRKELLQRDNQIYEESEDFYMLLGSLINA